MDQLLVNKRVTKKQASKLGNTEYELLQPWNPAVYSLDNIDLQAGECTDMPALVASMQSKIG
jgi:hypothetical protein